MTSADDIVHLRALYERYNHGIDTGDGAMFAGCFTEDGSLDTGGGPMVGRDAIGEFAVSNHAGLPAMRHQATNVVLDVDGDSATGAAFLTATLVAPEHTVLITGRYHDEFRRTEDGWRIARRVFTPDDLG